MKPTLAAMLALVTALATAGCSTPAQPATHTTHIHVAFAGSHADYDADVPFPAAGNLTAYQQILQWSADSGVHVEVATFPFGHCVDRIAGLPAAAGCSGQATAYWDLSLDGNQSAVGMDQVVLAPGDHVAWTLTALHPEAAPPPPGPLALAVEPMAPTRDATVRVHGNTTGPARLALGLTHANATAALPPIDVAGAGAWQADVPLALGDSTLRVTADDGATSANATLHLVRLAKGTVQLKFNGLPGHSDRNDEVWFDLDAHASAYLYKGRDLPHPDRPVAHDLMEVWRNQTAVPLSLLYYKGIGFFVSSIDGVGAPDTVGTVTGSSTWCYDFDGASANYGISTQPVWDGDTLTWNLGCA